MEGAKKKKKNQSLDTEEHLILPRKWVITDICVNV